MQITSLLQNDESELMDAKTAAHLEKQSEIFEQFKLKLLENHLGQYVWMVGEQVMDADQDFAALFDRVVAQVGEEPIFIRRVVAEAKVPMVRGAVMR
jgi:hypothetical protein